MFENGWKISFNGITNEKQFVCSCGHHWVYDETYQKDHCSACNNELFLDYDNFINTQKHLYPNDFKYTTKSFLHTDTWEVKFSCKIPLYDARLNAIGFKTNELITAVCDSSGNTTIVYIDDFVKEKMVYTGTSGKLSSYLTPKIAQELAQTIIDNRPEILDWLPLEQFYNIDKKEHLKVIQFLLKNRDVKDLDIYFWSQENLHLLTDRSNSSAALDSLIDEKHSKSVKKALYRYYYGLDITKRYDFTFDYTVLKYFDDPNYLRELIDIPTPHKELLFEDISVIEIDVAMTFFKHFYNESQLFNIFKKALCTREQFNLLHDCFRMLRDRSNLDAFVEHYTKQKVNLTAIHDELIYVQNLYVSSNAIDLYKNF